MKPLIMPNVSSEEAVVGLLAALFEGTYRPQERTLRSLPDEFVLQVFDPGEPGSSREEITGDSFSIELLGGCTRGGFIGGGNVQVQSW